MIFSPRAGQIVQVWYNEIAALYMPLHGKLARMTISGNTAARRRQKAAGLETGPLNHEVMVKGQRYGVPCGNLRWPRAMKGASNERRQGTLF